MNCCQTARSKVWVCGRLLGLWVRIPPWRVCLSIVSVLCCQVEVSASAEHSTGGVLPTVLRRCMWSRILMNEEAMARVGPQCHRERKAI